MTAEDGPVHTPVTPEDAAVLARLPQSDALALDVSGHTLIVRLHRPTRSNALDEALMRDLRALWQASAAEPHLRCIVLTGSGRAFCAGADISMLAAPRTEIGVTAADELSFVPGRHVAIPVIVAVNGVCAGGGLHFVADADICIAGQSARFTDPHVTAGQVSGLEPVELLLRMRRDVVLRMALLGSSEILDAETARAAGLVSEVVEDEALLERALDLAARIVQGSPAAVRATRAVVRRFEQALLEEHLEHGWQQVQAHWAHPDSTEGPNAFSEKRRPRWQTPS